MRMVRRHHSSHSRLTTRGSRTSGSGDVRFCLILRLLGPPDSSSVASLFRRSWRSVLGILCTLCLCCLLSLYCSFFFTAAAFHCLHSLLLVQKDLGSQQASYGTTDSCVIRHNHPDVVEVHRIQQRTHPAGPELQRQLRPEDNFRGDFLQLARPLVSPVTLVGSFALVSSPGTW